MKGIKKNGDQQGSPFYKSDDILSYCLSTIIFLMILSPFASNSMK